MIFGGSMRRLVLVAFLFLSGCFSPKADFASAPIETHGEGQQQTLAKGPLTAAPDDLLCGAGLGAPRTAAAAAC
jgi:hypothetical protein